MANRCGSSSARVRARRSLLARVFEGWVFVEIHPAELALPSHLSLEELAALDGVDEVVFVMRPDGVAGRGDLPLLARAPGRHAPCLAKVRAAGAPRRGRHDPLERGG